MSEIHRSRLHANLVAIACAGLTGLVGCGSFDGASSRVVAMVSPYKADIVQGNVVTREQLAAIKPGMSRAQVRDILGTSLLVSVFHADRWDYVFTIKRQGVQPQPRKVTIFFKNDLMESTQADELPSEAEFVATLKSGAPKNSAPALEAPEDTLKKFPLPSRAVPKSPPAATVQAEYPPLEPARP